eukprot:gene10860-7526_t
MPRVRRAIVAREASKALREYLQSRLWHWAVKQNYALSTDYAIHLLNHASRDPLGLCVGGQVAALTGQKELAERCERAGSRLSFVKSVTDLCDLIQGSPSGEEVKAWRQDIKKLIESGCVPPREESLLVPNTAALETTQKLCRAASLRANKEPLVEVLEPVDTTYGRGLYVTKRVSSGTCLLVDEPFLVQASSKKVCAHCLVSISDTSKGASSAGVVCPNCEQEHYCSEACQEAAWTSSHSCCCSSINPQYTQWQTAVWETLEKDRSSWMDANSSFRAALSCLAVGKLCSLATVRQCHPLSLPGVDALRGVADYDREVALGEVGGLAVTLSTALRQPYLFMEELLSLFALLQTNDLLNHSCVPNCVAVGTVRAPTKRQLVAVRDLRGGEQLMIDYNSSLTSRLKYEDRQALCAQRHFTCFCPKCVRRE